MIGIDSGNLNRQTRSPSRLAWCEGRWPIGTILHCVSKNVQSLTGYSFHTHPPIFIIFGTSSADVQNVGCRYNFLNYLAFTYQYFILLWSETMEMMCFSRHCYSVMGTLCKHGFSVDDRDLKGYNYNARQFMLAFPSKSWTKQRKVCRRCRFMTSVTWSSESPIHGEALRRASSTRPLINGEHDWVHAWRRRFIILNICCKQPVLFRATWPQKRLFFRATHSLPKKRRCTLRV